MTASLRERARRVRHALKSDRRSTGDPRPRAPREVGHERFWPFLAERLNDPGVRVLEIGSREVSSASLWREFFPRADYTGFDVMAGTNVDVVGDAHRLSEHFEPASFDWVVSTAVFEHLAMPWIAVEEIAKVLRVGGHALVETHFCFSEHELPWNFFHYHFEGLKVLFCEPLGFEVLDAGFSTPIVGRFSEDAAPYLRGRNVSDLYCHVDVLARKTRDVLHPGAAPFDWRAALPAVTGATSYPEGTGRFGARGRPSGT